MCCCGKPSINGSPNGYSWDGKVFMTYQPNAPVLGEHDTLRYDLPGRCGGMDSHAYHLCVVAVRFGGPALLVRHGGGEERVSLGHRKVMLEMLEQMDETARYWFLMEFYHLLTDAARDAVDKTNVRWRTAAAEKRIRTKKLRGRDAVKVWIEPATGG